MSHPDWQKALVAVLLCASLAEFAIRGPLRAAHSLGWNDFLSPYIQAKAWVHGKDPYNAQVLVSFWPADDPRPPWVDVEATQGTLERKRGMPSPYPLPTLVVFSPFALLTWSTAIRVWIVISIGSVLAGLFALVFLSKRHLLDLRSLIFVAVVLALAPLHTGVATANPTLLTVSLAVLAFWAARAGRPNIAGVLLGIAVCIKPTLAAGFLLYHLFRREWKLVGLASGLTATVCAVGVMRLWIGGEPWLSSYLLASRKMFGPGSLDDFARIDSIRFNMINGQVFFFSLLRNASAANVVTWLLAMVLLGCCAWLFFQGRNHNDVLRVAALSLLTLIPVYHRFYDAALLIWPLAWGLLLPQKRSVTILSAILVLPFLVPGPIVLDALARSGQVPPLITDSWWWSAIVLPHQVLDLILWALLLLYWMSQPVDEGGPADLGFASQRSLTEYSAALEE